MTKSKRDKREAPAGGVVLIEREQHGRVRRESKQVVDAHGDIGDPFVAESLLERLELSGSITQAERLAGEEFQRLFYLAQLHALRAGDMARVVVSGSKPPVYSETAERAGNRIAAALDVIGRPNSPARLVCWHVLGEEMSLREFERREGWDERTPLSREASKGALIGVLGVLENFFAFS